MTDLKNLCQMIIPPDGEAKRRARERWDNCAKPLESLGLLEDAVTKTAALTGDSNVTLKPRTVCVFIGDHGVVEQGVSQTGREVTAAVARQLGKKRTPVCRMAAEADCNVVAIDMGIAAFPGCEGVLDRRTGNGTRDFTKGAAMTAEQAKAAVLAGADIAKLEAEKGTKLLAAGEMGIGNTTSASAVASVLLDAAPETVTGRGAGLSDAGLERKLQAVRKGISLNRPDAADPLDVLAKLGGFEIAGMCGLFLGGAAYRIPVLIDGFLSGVAALCASRICPLSVHAMLASHVSAEPAGRLVLNALSLQPLIDAKMRLGEGTGAVCAMPLLDLALAVYRDAGTFEEGGIVPYVPQ